MMIASTPVLFASNVQCMHLFVLKCLWGKRSANANEYMLKHRSMSTMKFMKIQFCLGFLWDPRLSVKVLDISSMYKLSETFTRSQAQGKDTQCLCFHTMMTHSRLGEVQRERSTRLHCRKWLYQKVLLFTWSRLVQRERITRLHYVECDCTKRFHSCVKLAALCRT